MDDRDEPQWQPVSQMPLLTAQIGGVITLAQTNYTLLHKARCGEYRLSGVTLDGITSMWTQIHEDLEDFIAQGKRWQTHELAEAQRDDLERCAARATEAQRLVDQILGLVEDLKPSTIETLLDQG